jgi:iron complex outermembrane receptor protein
VNAKESQYRGVELGWTWLLPYVDGWRLTGAFTHMESKYVSFIDQFVVGGVLTQVNQSGHSVPAVERNVLNTKALYQHPSGWGGWFELSWIDSFFINNANTLGSPAYILCNLNIHDRYELKNNKYVRYVKSFFQISNLFDKTYVASAVPIADSTPDPSKQAFFAGYGRAFYGGVTLGF